MDSGWGTPGGARVGRPVGARFRRLVRGSDQGSIGRGGFLVYSFFPVVCVFLVKFVKLIKIVVH